MKLVTAYVPPFVLERVMAGLHGIPGLSGATFSDARGFGRGRAHGELANENIYGVSPRVRVEVVIDDWMEDMVVTTLAAVARTGHRGDGKIVVSPVTSVTRIAPHASGPEAS